MTPAEFLRHGHKSWLEIHWTRASTWEQVNTIMKLLGLEDKEVHRMTFPTNVKGSDGFYAYWIVLE